MYEKVKHVRNFRMPNFSHIANHISHLFAEIKKKTYIAEYRIYVSLKDLFDCVLFSSKQHSYFLILMSLVFKLAYRVMSFILSFLCILLFYYWSSSSLSFSSHVLIPCLFISLEPKPLLLLSPMYLTIFFVHLSIRQGLVFSEAPF